MDKTEEMASKAYPKDDAKVFHSAFGTLEIDNNAPGREGYIKGYRQAQQDLALTAEDVALIVKINEDVIEEAGGTPGDYFRETLRRFNETRGNEVQ